MLACGSKSLPQGPWTLPAFASALRTVVREGHFGVETRTNPGHFFQQMSRITWNISSKTEPTNRMHIILRKPKRTFFGISQWGSQSSLLRKLCFSACKTVLCVLNMLLQSWTPALRALDLHFKAAIFQPELGTCTSRTILALQSCDFPARAGKLHTSCTRLVLQLRFSS